MSTMTTDTDTTPTHQFILLATFGSVSRTLSTTVVAADLDEAWAAALARVREDPLASEHELTSLAVTLIGPSS